MGDPRYLYPVSLQWGDGPERLKKSKNKLLLYFQKRRESTGGECEIRDTDCTRGHILIHFKEEGARDRVLQKGSHLLKLPNGEELPLNVSLPDTESPDTAGKTPGSATGSQASRAEEDKAAPDDEVSPSSLVLIENVKDSDAPEMLNLLVENISEKVPDTDFYVEIIPEIHSAVVTFTCDIDIPRFIKTFSSNLRVAYNKLTAKPLEESRSVRVENVPEKTSEMYLAAFFENPKQGGGRVEDIVMVPEERAALITFQDTADVKRVLKKDHVFSKKNISVYPYYPILGIALYGKDRPCIEIPKPIEFNISPYILEHICNNEGLKNDIDVKMKDKHCEIKWPDLDCQNPVLQLVFPPTLSTNLRSVTKIVPKWKEEVYSEFSLFISKFTVIEYKMDESVWETIREHVSSSTYDGVVIRPDFGLEKVFLAGLSKNVTKIDPTFRQLIEETTKQVERKKQTKTETLSMSPALYQIMCNSGLKKKILDQVPELKMDYDVPRKTIYLSGLRDEVLTAKCEILDIKQQMKSKPIQINPHLVQFLVSTDNEEISSLLFVRHNINAMLEIEDGVVKLMAHSKEDLTAAENQIKENLDHRQLLVEDKSLLKSPEWESLQSHLLQLFNEEKITVLIQESSGTEDNVVISGLTSNVITCYQQVSDFLEKNSTIETKIPVQPSAKMTFIWKERREMLEKIKKNVNVTKNRDSISLSGPRVKVQEEVNVIKDILHSLHSDILRIEKPGAKKFCKINEEGHATIAWTNYHCVIRLEEAGVEDNLFSKPRFQITLSNGMTLSVYKDDLCRHNVDVIINAANEDLKHGGGLAKAILDAAGRKVQDDCDRIIRKDGRLSTGDSVITDAGKLQCKQIIHTVGPRWGATSPSTCERLLRRAITTSLQLASEKSHSSIAIPAVSSGIFGFPLKLCIENIVEAIRDYAEMAEQQSTLQRIHLVDMNDETVNIFSEVTKAKFGNQMSDVPSKAMAPQPVTRVAQSPPVPVNRGNDNTVRTKEGLKIKLRLKNIEDCSTDVIVNSVGDDLNLNAGAVSKALLSRAGSNMQQLLNDESLGTQGAPGSVFSTDGCNLNCQEVLHVVTPQWDNGQGTSKKILRKIIKDCLALAEQNQWTSISFPAIGTGILGFPKDLVAFVMFDEIFQFSCKNKVQNLQEVHLVLHPSDMDTIKAFTSQLENCTDAAASGATNRQSAGTGSTFFGTVTDPSLGVHEMKIGSVTYQVKTGDITKEKTDVIVNSSNKDFTLCTGVSKAILDAAGPSVVSSAAALGAQPHTGYVITDSGNITQCKWILHVVGTRDPASIKMIVLDVLQECEKRRVSSVTFPALGTGAGGLAASMVADSILDGLVDFMKSKSVHSLQTVKVVLFQQSMLNDFYMSMKTREGSALPETKSILTRLFEFIMPPKASKRVQKLTAFQLMDGIEPVVFSLCAEDKRSVEKTKAWLHKMIDSEQAEKVITEECISELEEAEVQKISDLQKSFQVSVIYKPADPSIRIVGLTRDVLPVSGEIEKVINRVKDRNNRERAAELTGKLVEWSYDNGGTMIPFDKVTNLELEEAKNDKTAQITIQIRGNQYTVSVQRETATDQRGNQIQIQRVLKHEGDSNRLPSHWKPMGGTLVMEVDVAQGTPEYSAVEQKFQKTCGHQILKILRVQNRDLWLNYQIKKQNIDSKNGSTTNEKELFHGTDSNSIQHVNHNGFNRSYAGKNGTAFGNGTYFAVNAQYSVGYARPDVNRERHMYLARVLTGLYCVGNQTIITPPAKNAANPTDLYDSVTDNLQNPSMFVIFNDIQAYPEYHIVF
ncbi:LOW QUALITY PROTEIN: protein mono-ADP-ribosyltransferase PARP14-like [Rana temporaria]|uniref:LOW QUALITY PROTEIN: protein mono-ADP-ribosyltransferase PARP14-like n=1 Tax=Rana temporaria TaxID=8407 RepID=UPI001AAC494B|nr:LOW QUALITY PROTEIN: protein mono-ADP-ribosyltransferase PARP14-like [Rana temporaria]